MVAHLRITVKGEVQIGFVIGDTISYQESIVELDNTGNTRCLWFYSFQGSLVISLPF